MAERELTSRAERETAAVTVQGIRTLGTLSETAIEAVRDILVEFHSAAKSNALIGIVDSLVTVNVLRKLGVIDPHVEQTVVNAIASLLNLNVQSQQVALAGQILTVVTFGLVGGGAVTAGLAENILIPQLRVSTNVQLKGAPGSSIEAAQALIAGLAKTGASAAAEAAEVAATA